VGPRQPVPHPLDPEEAENYAQKRDALEHGYPLEYEQLAQGIAPEEDGLSEEGCREVRRVLRMYDHLRSSHDTLPDTAELKPDDVRFPEFSGNAEGWQLGYCRWVCAGARFSTLDRGVDDFDSHLPMLDGYRRMLQAWDPLVKQGEGGPLSIEHIRAILLATAPPDSPGGQLLRADVEGPPQ
jgi:uncharacterized protein